MANMSYCRMENTYEDLKDVQRHWDEADSESELKFRKRILELAKELVEEHGEEDDDDEED
ncbi:MAG: hypothetical protein Q8O88_03905 [bacterium]|nr:hypothetical protein [bacterium]